MLRKSLILFLSGLSFSVEANISRIVIQQGDGSRVYRNVYDPQKQFKDANDRPFGIFGFVASEEVHDYVISLQKRFLDLPQSPLIVRTARLEHELTQLPFLYYYSHWKKIPHDRSCFFANLDMPSPFYCRYEKYVHKDDLTPWGSESLFPQKPMLRLLFLDIGVPNTLDESGKRYLGHQLGHMAYTKKHTEAELRYIAQCRSKSNLILTRFLRNIAIFMGKFIPSLYRVTFECSEVLAEEERYCAAAPAREP